jgi:hypothetical protein
MLTIGAREKRFPGMLDHCTFNVVVGRDGHGTGIASLSGPDASGEYDGKAGVVHLQPKR